MKKITMLLLAGLMSAAAARKEVDVLPYTSRDLSFCVAVTQGGMLQVMLGRLAQTNALLTQVKMHGQHMIEDHGKLNEELRKLALKKSIPLPEALDNERQRLYDELSRLTGEEFDRRYIRVMIREHKRDIRSFRRYARSGDELDIRSWSALKLPVLERHLEMWEEAYRMASY
ncbi:MAG: DUF4142 domain-containing protein [Bacteroidota bacterium]